MKNINNDVFYRFEPNIDNGILIVFFKKSNKIYELTKPYYIFLKCIENLEDNFDDVFLAEYPNLSVDEIRESIRFIEEKLIKIGVLL